MGGSRRPRSDHYFITVRDGELKNAQAALKSWSKDVTVLHSTLFQTMLLLGCLELGCQDFSLLDFFGLYNFGAKTLSFLRGSEVSPGFLQLPERSLALSSLPARQSILEWM